MKYKRKIVMSGGGTGGHIFPAVAIAQQIRRLCPDTDILFIGAKGKMEMEKVPQAGFAIEGLDITGFSRSSLIKNLSLPFKLVRSWLQVRAIFRRFRPEAAVGVGGYSSFPVLSYAQRLGLPTFIHESNSFAGKSNILLGKRATRIYVASAGMERFFPEDRITVTGNPVRATIRSGDISKEESVRHFGFDPAKPILLVVGGSLGARSINEAVDAGMDRLLAAGLQVIWQTGVAYQPVFRNESPALRVTPFITEMGRAYTAADLIISRAGAMAIAEIQVMGKPAIFVPYPFAAEDHQSANAKEMVRHGAGLMVADADASRELVDKAITLAADAAQRQAIGAAALALAVKDADERIARDILEVLEQSKTRS